MRSKKQKRRSGPNNVRRYTFCAVLILLIVVVFEVRLAQWQLVQGDEFEEISLSASSASVKMEATRGEILDINGEVLAGNRTIYNVTVNSVGLDDKELNRVLADTVTLLEARGQKWINKLPIEKKNGGFVFKEDMDSDIAYMKGPYMLNMQSYATAQDCMDHMTELYECETIEDETLQMKVISVRYYMQKIGFSRRTPYTLAEDISEDTVAMLKGAAAQLPGVTVTVGTERYYANGTTAPHIVGEIYSITQEQYDALSEGEKYSTENMAGYAYTDKRGQSGIEYAFEAELRGENGKKLVYTDSTGAVTGTEVAEAPMAGNSVYLTLDSNLQRVANVSLAKNVQAARENGEQEMAWAIANNEEETEGFGEDCYAGAAVVLRVKDFAVLAAANCPSYDMNLYTTDMDYLQALYKDETTPMYNRAFSGTFTPGSVFKPCVAAAALEEDVIDISSWVFCEGLYTYYDDYQPKCMGIHQDISVCTALEKSCNVFFFDCGRQLGIQRLEVYANLFGLGVKTGLELSEAAGTMSNPAEYKENHGVSWTDGLTIQASIGQLDNSFSPLQLAAYCATVANNGVRLETHLLDHISDYARQTTVQEYTPVVAADTGISHETLQIVQQGMRQVVTGGTAASQFADYGIAVAAKTGTAEVPGHSDNATFIAYAPYENPEIAVAVVLQYGASGTYSMQVAKDIFDAYFYGKTVNENGELVFPEEEPEEGDLTSAVSSEMPAASTVAGCVALAAGGSVRRCKKAQKNEKKRPFFRKIF